MEMKLSRGHFGGLLLNKREVGRLTLTEYEYSPDLKLSRHEHEQAYFCLVLQGSYDETFGRRTRKCEPMTVTFHPAGESHSDFFYRTGGRIFSVEVDPAWVERVGEISSLLDDSADFHGGALAALIIRMYNELHNPDNVSHLAIEGLALEVIAEASRRHINPSTRKPARWLEQARELLHERFSETLTLSLIAEQVGVHPVHLVREFRKHYQLTVGEYIRHRRIEYACQQLCISDTPLIDIAIDSGFSHQSHFSKTFKEVTGMTPARYRASSRPR
jgi:AraC family transcriptional regulator